MDINLFLQHPEVRASLADLHHNWNDRAISDLVDDQGRQYVDLVMEGGGVLGIALVGYTYALESVGIRFLGIGGTSAGAINALLQAGSGPPAAAKSETILAALAEVDLIKFVDGDGDARRFIKAMLRKAGRLCLLWRGLQVVDNVCDDLGLNPGEYFHTWMKAQLATHGIDNCAELKAQMRDLPPMHHRLSMEKVPVEVADPKLVVIAADVTTETKVTFPDMAELYFDEPELVSPADFVRASMSIPLFFQPYRVRHVPQGDAARQRWKDKAGYRGELPLDAYFVDGGVLSNFPIQTFHIEGEPSAPTFGAKLGGERTLPKEIDGPGALAGAIFDSARHVLDYDFILRNPDYRKLVSVIQTDRFHWLDFKMSDQTKADLFATGVKAAAEFLLAFDWQEYKDLRAGRIAGAS